MMADQTLTHPTVAEVIKALSAYPQDAKLTIEDADTYKTISIIHISDSVAFGGDISLCGCYGEME